ncbi:MAG: beta-galactosidase trimerization domain-containing protein [Clostridia bacterium]|nr:beta-galactosidase trimerization domain-containing protein [Clostridia bacterium]
MKNDKLRYYEQIEKTGIDILAFENEKFSYVSKTSIHSEVTDWAYGEALERECISIDNGKEAKGEATLENTDRRFFLKIIACMPNWQEYVLPLTVTVNGKTVYENKEAFFEQVNLGWPALYVELPENALVKGKNTFVVKAEKTLYLSELSLVSYPKPQDLSQVSAREYVRINDRFAVAVRDEKHSYKKVESTENCELVSAHSYKDLCILSFKPSRPGEMNCTAVFGDKSVTLDMPKAVDNTDDFVFGIDSDDHRHDDSDETAFIVETTVFSDMGNYVQFRPQPGRNHHKLLDKKGYGELIGLITDFGMKYGLCDCDVVLEYLPDICPEYFYGYHIHEPYLFFNPALLENPFESERFLCEPEKINASSSFGESKELYMQVLKKSKKLFSKDKGLTSFGSPSLLCVYESKSGVDRITIEPVSNINLLTGAVRANTVKIWGAHVPTDWYFGVPVDEVKSNKYRLAMQYLYLNGASYLYAENSLFKTNAFERCDWESDFCVTNRKYQRQFYEYAMTHPRVGNQVIDKAIVYGRNEFFMWKLNNRIAELKEKDWDSYVWGKWDNAYQIAWNASEAWLPASDKQNVYESPLNKNVFSGTPYGSVDVIYAENDLSKYKQLAFLGWNTMDEALLSRLKDYVRDGGTLMISYCNFNLTDVNDKEPTFPESSAIKDFIGLDISGYAKVGKTVSFSDGTKLGLEAELEIALGELCGAKPICVDENGNDVVYENTYGKGKIYLVAFKDYIEKENDIKVLSHLMKVMGESGDVRCDNNNVSFTVRETESEYRISVLNMNCIEGADEEYTISFRGQTATGKIKVGEIADHILAK